MSTLRFGALFTTEYESTQNVVIADTVGLSDQSNKDTVVVISDSIGVSDYDAQGINTGALVSQVHVQAESQLDPLVAVSHVHVQSETQETPLIAVSHAHVQIEITVALSAPVGDSVGVTDAIVVTHEVFGTDHENVASDDVGLSDAVSITQGIAQYSYPEDSVGVSDDVTVTKWVTHYRYPADDVALSDDVVATHLVAHLRYPADSVGVQDQSDSFRATRIYIGDSVGLSDDESRIADFFRAIAESMGLVDAASQPPMDYVRIIASQIYASDLAYAEHIEAFVRTIADTVGVSDEAVWSILERVSVADDLGLSDAVAYLQGTTTYVSVSDDVGLTDENASLRAVRRFAGDVVGLSDSAYREMAYGRTPADTVWARDIRPLRKRSNTIIIADSVLGRDNVLPRGLVKYVAVGDSVGLIDSGPGAISGEGGGDAGGGVGGRVGVPGPTVPGGSPWDGGTDIAPPIEGSDINTEMTPEMQAEHPFGPAYPMTELIEWGLLNTVFESGVEQDVPLACYPFRGWDMNYYSTVRSAHVDAFRSFINRQTLTGRPFLFREPYRSTRFHVKIGHGDGARTNWVVPVYDATSLTFYVNSAPVGYSISSGTGVASLGVVTISAPAPTDVVAFSFMDGYYAPMVVIRDVFQYSHEGPDYGTIKFGLKELKLDYPEA